MILYRKTAIPMLLAAATFCAVGSAHAQKQSFEFGVQALQDKDKNTDVIFTARPINGSDAPTALKQVQLKSFDTDGRLRWTKNQSDVPATGNPASATLTYTDMMRFQPVQAQVLIQTGATTKTEVYREKTPVLLRPDLTIQSLTASSQSVRPRQLVNIMAAVSELNLDVGAVATLTLRHGATQIDQISGVWVNKGSSSAAVFVAQFEKPGTYTLIASIEGAVPRDYDTSNDSKSITIKVEELPSYYSLEISGYSEESTGTYSDPYWGSYSWSSKYGNEWGRMHVWTNNQSQLPTFPITMAGHFAVDNGPALKSFNDSVGLTGTWTNGCWKNESGFKNLGEGTYLYAGSISDACGTYSYAWATANHYAHEYVYFSQRHAAYYGSGSYSSNYSHGTMLRPTSSMQARLTVRGSNGAQFGGSGQTNVRNYQYERTYSPPYTGSNKIRWYDGWNQGVVTP